MRIALIVLSFFSSLLSLSVWAQDDLNKHIFLLAPDGAILQNGEEKEKIISLLKEIENKYSIVLKNKDFKLGIDDIEEGVPFILEISKGQNKKYKLQLKQIYINNNLPDGYDNKWSESDFDSVESLYQPLTYVLEEKIRALPKKINFDSMIDTISNQVSEIKKRINQIKNRTPINSIDVQYHNYYLGIHYYRLACYSNFKERNEFLDSCLFFIQRMDVSFKPEEKKKYAQLHAQYKLFSNASYKNEAVENWWLNTYEKKSLDAKSLKSALDADGLQGKDLYIKIHTSFQVKAVALNIKKGCDLSFLNYYLSQCTREVNIETNCTLSEILSQSNLNKEFKSGVVYNLYVKKKDCQLPDHLQFLRVFEK